jgi:ribonuclease HI
VGDSHTNNYAEYMGLIEGLRMAVEMGVSDVVVQGDSKLVIKQMTGEFVVRSASLRPLWEEARRLLSSIPQHRFEHIPRSANARADELANRAMDRRQGVRASGGSTPNGDNLLGQK